MSKNLTRKENYIIYILGGPTRIRTSVDGFGDRSTTTVR